MIDCCPSCRSRRLRLFYEVDGAPAHSVLLFSTRREAQTYPTGRIRLGLCESCGFISNLAFDPALHDYSPRYEETQGFSATFNAFHRRLATSLIDRYDLHGKQIVEIGCGKGEFLALLCELGDNRGIGFDPAYVSGRISDEAARRITFIPDFYSDKYAAAKGDFIVCKMTLEHIHDPVELVSTVRRSVGDDHQAVVFFQVPDVGRVLRDVAFWDIYYEHCSYFSAGSLARLFRRAGFQVMAVWHDYDDQYLMIEARPGPAASVTPLPAEDDLALITAAVNSFSQSCRQTLTKWRHNIERLKADGRRVVLWGGGSKGVAFLTTLGINLDQIAYVVDVNPHKAGTFMAGAGQEVVAPDFLKTYRPDVVIVMNPIYKPEIQRDLEQMGVAPEVIDVRIHS